MAKKVKWLLVVLIVVGLGWSALWYTASFAAGAGLAKIEQRSAASGTPISCSEQQISGYPFHMQVSCAKAVIASNGAGLSAVIDSVKSVALLYKPGHVIAEAVGPISIQLPQEQLLGAKILGSWKSAQASVSAGLSGLKRASIVGQNIDFSFEKDQPQNPLDGVKLEDVQLHVRPNQEIASNFDIALNAKNIVVTRLDRALPSIRLSLLASALDVGEAIDFDVESLLYAWIESGGAMEIQSAQFDSLGFTAKASGPINVSVDGLLSGKVQVELLNLAKLPDLVSEISPRFRANAEQLAATLNGFTAGNPDGPVVVTLLINNGVVSAGILPIGRIPALF